MKNIMNLEHATSHRLIVAVIVSLINIYAMAAMPEREADRVYDMSDASLWCMNDASELCTYLPTGEQLYTCEQLPSDGCVTIGTYGLELPRYERRVETVVLTLVAHEASSLRVYWFDSAGIAHDVVSNLPIDCDSTGRMAIDVNMDDSWTIDGGYLSIRPRSKTIKLSCVEVYLEDGTVTPPDPNEAYVAFVPDDAEQPDGTPVSATLARQFVNKGYLLTINGTNSTEFTLHFTEDYPDYTIEYQVIDADGTIVKDGTKRYTWASCEAPVIQHNRTAVPASISLFDELIVNCPTDASLDVTVSYRSDKEYRYTRHIPTGCTPRVRMFEPDALGQDITVSATAYTGKYRPATTTVTTLLNDDYTIASARAVVDTPADDGTYSAGDKIEYHIETHDGYRWHTLALQQSLKPWCYAKLHADTEFSPFFDYYDLYTEPLYLLLDSSCLIQFLGKVSPATDIANGQYYLCTVTADTEEDNTPETSFRPVADDSDIKAAQLRTTPQNNSVQTLYNHYIVTATDDYGNVYAMTTIGNDSYTGLDAIRIDESRTAGDSAINIRAGHNAACLTLIAAGTESAEYIAGWSDGHPLYGTSVTYDQAIADWMSAKDTHLLTYDSFNHRERTHNRSNTSAKVTDMAQPLTITHDRITFGETHPGHEIVFSRDTRVFECTCTSSSTARSTIHLAANFDDSFSNLNTTVDTIPYTTQHITTWYTLQGIPLPSPPTVPGLYIRHTPDGKSTLYLLKNIDLQLHLDPLRHPE